MFVAIERMGGPFGMTSRVVIDGSSINVLRNGTATVLAPLTAVELGTIRTSAGQLASVKRAVTRRHRVSAFDRTTTRVEIDDGQTRRVFTFATDDVPTEALLDLLRVVQRIEASRAGVSPTASRSSHAGEGKVRR